MATMSPLTFSVLQCKLAVNITILSGHKHCLSVSVPPKTEIVNKYTQVTDIGAWTAAKRGPVRHASIVQMWPQGCATFTGACSVWLLSGTEGGVRAEDRWGEIQRCHRAHLWQIQDKVTVFESLSSCLYLGRMNTRVSQQDHLPLWVQGPRVHQVLRSEPHHPIHQMYMLLNGVLQITWAAVGSCFWRNTKITCHSKQVTY